MVLYLAEEAGLLCSPISGHPIVEVGVYPSVKFIDVDRFEAILQALLLGLEGRNRRLVLLLFVGMAGVESLSNPIEHLAIEPEATQHFTEVALEHFLPDVGLFTSAPVAGAMIVDVALLLDFSDERTPAMPTSD
jgi:hypothetical protein